MDFPFLYLAGCNWCINLDFLAGALDDGREIADGDLDGEIESGKHDGGEDVPAEDACDKRKASASLDHSCGFRGVAHGAVPEASGEEREGRNEGEEDHDEDNVGADGQDEVDQAHDSHPEKEETESVVKFWCTKTGVVGWVKSSIIAIGMVEWDESEAECNPERAEAEEDNHGEGVANDELAEATEKHENTAIAEVGTNASRSITGHGSSPVHQVVGQGSQGQQETDERNRSGVGKGPAEFALDLILRGQIDLLKELWGHGDAPGSLDLVEGFISARVVVEMLMVGVVGHLGGSLSSWLCGGREEEKEDQLERV